MGLEALLAAAEARHGLVLRRELAGLGVSRARARTLVAEGWLREVLPGVLSLGGDQPSEWQTAVAATLRAGGGSAISHSTAARVHRMAVAPVGSSAPDVSSLVEISIAPGVHRRVRGAIIHRERALRADEVDLYRGVRVTVASRTLVDLLPRLTPAALEKLVDEGSIRGLWDYSGLAVAADRAKGRKGVDTLRRLLVARLEIPAVDSPLEHRAVRVLGCLHPFETRYQLVLEGQVLILDIAWPAYRVAAECDGWQVRSRSRGKFDHERRRNNLLASHGWTVVHLTSSMSDDEMRAAVFKVLVRAPAG